MCTSFTLQSQDGLNLLSRTMDFAFVLDPDLVMIPRSYKMNSYLENSSYTTKYAFVGLSKKLDEYVFADGVNEKGLTCASLYFVGYATYNDKVEENMQNLAPHELVSYLLARYESVEEVKEAFKEINLVSFKLDLLGIIVPLHWIVSDASGACITIEPTKNGIKIHENSIGVMSNAPDFEWHMTNIRNYIGVSYTPHEAIKLSGVMFEPFGQGSGSVGMPGDYTPPSRFLRALFSKKTIEKPIGEQKSVNASFHVLSSVDIPKGSVKTQRGPDYTQYTACMVSNTATYYFKTYDNYQINKFSLLDHDLNSKEVLKWDIAQEENYNEII